MECRNCTESLSALIDGELDDLQKNEIEGHLAHCRPCLDEYHSLMDTRAWIDQVRQLDPSPALWERIHSEIRTLPSPKRGWMDELQSLLGPRWIPVTVGMFVLGLLVVGVSDNETEEALESYLKQREEIETAHSMTLVHINPFTLHDHPVRDNPFTKE